MAAGEVSREQEEARARGKLERIEHLVVLQLENRSFDHVLGYLDLSEHALKPPPGEFDGKVNGLATGGSNFLQRRRVSI